VRKVLAVIRREFIERVRQKWFWVMAALAPVFFGALVIVPTLLMTKGGVKHIVVVDGTTTTFGVELTARLDRESSFVAVRVPAGSRTTDSLMTAVDSKEIDGFLIVGDAAVDSGKAMYRASNVSSFVTIGTLEHVISEMVNARRLEREGVNPALVQKARIPLRLDSKKVSGGKETGESAGQSFALAYFMGIILYMAILLYGINVMSSVLEEKTTKIVEVLVSSVRPFQLLLGKVLGVGAVSIFQFLIWGVSTRLILSQRAKLFGANPGGGNSPFELPHVTGGTAAIFIAYFLGGFLLYSAMFAAVGAMSSNEQEARQAQQPVVMLLVASFISMFAMLNDPGSPLSVTLSMIPFSAPIAMPVRWAAGNLPLSEVALSLGILTVSILGVTWVASRIYRVGILMTGKRPNIKELVRWVRAA
jgi:ABC-2 type transport system permease protein